MQRLLFIALVLAIAPWCTAQQAKTVPQEILDEIAATGPVSLPKYLTPEEAKLPLPTPSRTSPPTGTIHCSAEYEPQEGLFIACSLLLVVFGGWFIVSGIWQAI